MYIPSRDIYPGWPGQARVRPVWPDVEGRGIDGTRDTFYPWGTFIGTMSFLRAIRRPGNILRRNPGFIEELKRGVSAPTTLP